MHVSERGVDAALSGDRVTPCGEELGDAGRVEAGLGKAEGGAEAGTAGADDNRIVLVVLGGNWLAGTGRVRGRGGAAYNDGVLGADMRRSLLCPERSVGDDAGWCGRVSEGVAPRGAGRAERAESKAAVVDLPAGRVVEKAREGVVVRVRESCEAQRTNGSVSVSTFGGDVAAVDLDSREEETHRRRRSEPSPSH